MPKKNTLTLSATEQTCLVSAKHKVAAINQDMLNSVGLTREEADVAAKAGLIDPDQKYWWLEDWQQGERQAERDEDIVFTTQKSRVIGPLTRAAAYEDD